MYVCGTRLLILITATATLTFTTTTFDLASLPPVTTTTTPTTTATITTIHQPPTTATTPLPQSIATPPSHCSGELCVKDGGGGRNGHCLSLLGDAHLHSILLHGTTQDDPPPLRDHDDD